MQSSCYCGKSSYNIVAGSVDFQVLPEGLDEKVAKLHLHLCVPLLATCPSVCRGPEHDFMALVMTQVEFYISRGNVV